MSCDGTGARDSGDPHGAGSQRAPARPTTAGRLLAAVTADGGLSIDQLARLAGVAPRELARCRDQGHVLDLDAQLRLAAIIAGERPSHARAARHLYEQAQAALRLETGAGRRHLTYPKEQFR
jgi:hypothetical protein